MNKSKINLVIDGLLLICIAGIGGIGILMRYVLVPGYMRWEIYGQNVNLFFWGLDRHEWGKIHFIISLAFLFLCMLHIILHWRMIIGIYFKLIPHRIARWVIALMLIMVTIILLGFAYFVTPEVTEQGQGQSHSLTEKN